MALSLKNAELEAHVAEKARAEGISANEYLKRLVEEDKRQFEELREKVLGGFASIDRGDFTEYGEESLKELFDDVEAEGLRGLSSTAHRSEVNGCGISRLGESEKGPR